MDPSDAIERNLFRYVWKHTRKEQLWLLVVTLASFPIYFISLDLPKRIVNGPIQGEGFADGSETYFNFTLPAWLSDEPITLVPGIELGRVDALIALSFTFLGFVLINGLFKFYINTQKGRLGERMLRRLRFELIDKLLRFPMPELKRIRASETATMIKDEVEPLGGFIGDAYIQPIFLLGQALTALIFIMVQSFWLGLIALGIVLLQTFLIPKLRRRLIELNRRRQLTARQLAGRVGEVVDGMAEIHTNDISNYERADISDRLGKLFFIRYEIFQRKFFIKFLNNLLAQITPFLFFLVGGLFALNGTLDIGQLVAVIAAYKDLPSPIKELIDWDQQRLDVQVKYQQVVEQFAPASLIPSNKQDWRGQMNVATNTGELNRVMVVDETGAKLAEDVSFTFKPGEAIVAVGEINAGAEAVVEAMVGILPVSGGHLRYSGTDVTQLSEGVLGQRISYVSPTPYLASGSLRDALTYAIKTRASEADRPIGHPLALIEAERSGSPKLNASADWINYDAARIEDDASLDARLLTLLEQVSLKADVFEMGLRGTAKLAKDEPDSELDALLDRKPGYVITPEETAGVLSARAKLRDRVKSAKGRPLVESFDPDVYSRHLSIAENLLFGAPKSSGVTPEALCEEGEVVAAMAAHGLDRQLFNIGHGIARNIVELFGELAPGNPLFDDLAFMTPEQVPAYASLLSRMGDLDFADASKSRRQRLWRLAFQYVEPKHRFGLLDSDAQNAIVAARQDIRASLQKRDEPPVHFFDPDSFIEGATLEDNILFGRIIDTTASGPKRVRALILETLKEENLTDLVFQLGLAYDVGSGGKRLSQSQRQKVALARALLKRPDLLIVNRGLSAVSTATQSELLQAVLANRGTMSVIWVPMAASLARYFDRALVFDDGRLVEHGTPDELLAQPDTRLAKLAA